MPSWNDVRTAAPDLAERVQARFTAHKHHTLATLRADGSPRIAGTEVQFVGGHLWMGSMGGARKARDLLRDGRMALHSSTADESMADGDARISGTATEVTDPADLQLVLGDMPPEDIAGSHLFRVDVHEIVLTQVQGDLLHITSWSPTRGEQHTTRT